MTITVEQFNAYKSVNDQAQAAFNRAIRTGRLTESSARDHMFMGFDTQGRATFKHRETRKYLAHTEGLGK